MFKMGQYLVKILTEVSWHVFYGPRCTSLSFVTGHSTG